MAFSLVLFVTIVFFLSLAIAGPVLRRLFRKPCAEEITPEWLENFSLDRYRSMSGLLANDDFAFLSRQPGFDLSLYRKLRRERLFIFREYFNRLIVDFNRLHLTARILVADGEGDSSDLAAVLFQLQMRFYVAVFRTEYSYIMCRLGLGTLSAQTLLEPLQALSDRITGLAGARALLTPA